MKKHFAQFYAFITEQQSWFEQHLAADFEQSWDDPVWVCGSNGSGWLRGNGKINYALMKSAVPKVLRGVMPWQKTMPGL